MVTTKCTTTKAKEKVIRNNYYSAKGLNLHFKRNTGYLDILLSIEWYLETDGYM